MKMINQYYFCLIVMTGLIFLTGWINAQDKPAISQQELSSILRERENTIESMECVFEVNSIPTTPENKALLEPLEASMPFVKFITTEEIAQKNSHIIHWWRKERMEREESFPLSDFDPNNASVKPDTIKAFDGKLVRSLNLSHNEISGTIQTAQEAHIETFNFIDPYSLLYEFEVMPYSELIGNGINFRMSKQEIEGKEYIQVSVQHPKMSMRTFVLIFDEKLRLVERQIIGPSMENPEPGINERHIFSNYKEHKDSSGKIIWFPENADYHYYKRLPESKLAEWNTKKINIKKIYFNPAIPDDFFALQFPLGTRVMGNPDVLALADNNIKWTKLAGKPLPGMNIFGIEMLPEDANNKMILMCFFDIEQRPSRNFIFELNKQAQKLKSLNIEIIAIHASKIDQTKLNEWIKENHISFSAGMIEKDEEQTRNTWCVQSLPWLVLTDKNHIVTDEGFSITELDEKIRK